MCIRDSNWPVRIRRVRSIGYIRDDRNFKSDQYHDQQRLCAQERAWHAAGNRHVGSADDKDATNGRTVLYLWNIGAFSWNRKPCRVRIILEDEGRRNVLHQVL